MVESIVQWLKERHILPFRDPDMIFATSTGDGEGANSVVKAVLDNPVYEAKMKPLEDNLVISFNNPLFQPTLTPTWKSCLYFICVCNVIYLLVYTVVMVLKQLHVLIQVVELLLQYQNSGTSQLWTFSDQFLFIMEDFSIVF